jgi:hypothetical protein
MYEMCESFILSAYLESRFWITIDKFEASIWPRFLKMLGSSSSFRIEIYQKLK